MEQRSTCWLLSRHPKRTGQVIFRGVLELGSGRTTKETFDQEVRPCAAETGTPRQRQP